MDSDVSNNFCAVHHTLHVCHVAPSMFNCVTVDICIFVAVHVNYKYSSDDADGRWRIIKKINDKCRNVKNRLREVDD